MSIPKAFILSTIFCLFLFTVNFAQSTGHVTIAITDRIYTINSLTATSSGVADKIRVLIFDSLLIKNEKLEYVGQLAESFDTSNDGQSITFHLRSNVRFHDGHILTSADVKYTFDELMNSHGFKSSYFNELKSGRPSTSTSMIDVKATDPRTVTITLLSPAHREQILSAISNIPIIPFGTVNQLDTAPVGSGPFRFAKLDAEKGTLELNPNDEYWGGAPKISGLTIRQTLTPESLINELSNGSVDLVSTQAMISEEDLADIGRNSKLEIHRSPGTNIQYLAINTRSSILKDVRVRQAIALAIDRQKMIDVVLSGRAMLANSIVPSQSGAYSAGTTYEFDPQKARHLLRSAKYNKQPIVLTVTNGNVRSSRIGGFIKASLENVGINVVIEVSEVNTIRHQLATGRFQIYSGQWIGGNQDPVFLKDLFSTSKIPGRTVSCCNRSRYSNRAVDQVLEQAGNELEPSKKQALYIRVWTMISGDVPMIPFWYYDNILVANKRIKNIDLGPVDDLSFIRHLTTN